MPTDHITNCPSSPNLFSLVPSKSIIILADPEVHAPPSQLPPPPPPPPSSSSLKSLTPLPSKQKLTSHSPPSCPLHINSNRNSRCSNSSLKVVRSPASGGAFRCSSFVVGDPPEQRAPTPPLHPPSSPTGYWENKVQSNPEFFLTPKSNGFKNAIKMAVPPEGVKKDAEKSEENVKPKLKFLHWDKVRTSSNRAMVWDQLKSSSFQ